MPNTAGSNSEMIRAGSSCRLAFGCAPIGNLFRDMPDEVATATIRAALDAGLRYFDTAPQYGFGLSEKRLGMVLAERDPGEAIVVSTKAGRRLDPALDADIAALRQCFLSPEPFESVFDYTYDSVMRTFEQSLARLRRTHVDILYAHDLGRFAHGDDHPRRLAEFLKGGYRAMTELRKAGAVGEIGIAVNECAICIEMLAAVEIDIIQLAGRYTLLEQEALDAVLPTCEQRGVSVVLGAPYNSGILATGAKGKTIGHFNYGPASADIVARVHAIENLCAAHGVTLAAAALQFPLAHPQVESVIAGINSPERVRDTVQAATVTIPPALWSDLKGTGLVRPDAPVPQA